MQEMAVLQELRADVEADPAGLQRARRLLLQRAEATAGGPGGRRRAGSSPSPRLVQRRVAIRLGLVAGLAAAAAGTALAVESATVDGHPVGASAAAAEALNRAADAALRRRPAPVPGPGQFLYRREVGGQPLGTMAMIVGKDGAVSRVPAGRSAQHLCQSVHEEWQPTDPRRPVLIRRTDGILLQPGTGDPTRMPHDPLCQFSSFVADGGVDAAGSYGAPTPAFVAGLPTDPQALYQRARRDARAGGHALVDDETFVELTDLGRSASPFLTPKLTAAVFRATALVPGVDYVGQGHDLLGRAGTVIGRTEPARGERREIVFDTTTGIMLGEKSIITRPDPGDPAALPAGTVSWQSAITNAVVDRPPPLRRSPTR